MTDDKETIDTLIATARDKIADLAVAKQHVKDAMAERNKVIAELCDRKISPSEVGRALGMPEATVRFINAITRPGG